MKKIFVVQFGGTPSRTELCLLMNCGAGLYQDLEFVIYPFDKDIRSPNYVNSRAYCEDYQSLHEMVGNGVFASAEVRRIESLFDTILKNAEIEKGKESIRELVSDNNVLKEEEQMLLDICFTREEQQQELEGGYFGRADIGAVTSGYLIYKKAYDELQIVTDIEKALKEKKDIDVVILCSSFGGTGASLGINFGSYLAEHFKNNRKMLRLHCIHIQPYFSFPDPSKDDKWKVNSRSFYSKSATVISSYGNRNNFVRNVFRSGAEQEANAPAYIFDSFYYLGQEVLDNVSDTNSARDHQENSLHIIDMLVSLAIEDAVNRKIHEEGPQVYGYLYSGSGTDKLSWENMKDFLHFKSMHLSFARFSAFMIQVIEPLLELPHDAYVSEALISHIYGASGLFSKKARVSAERDEQLHEKIRRVVRFCRKYLEYWNQIETSTKYGTEASVTNFFCQDEIRGILTQKKTLENGRADLQLDKLICEDGTVNYKTDVTGMKIYDQLCRDSKLKNAASESNTLEQSLKVILNEIYRQCQIEIAEK